LGRSEKDGGIVKVKFKVRGLRFNVNGAGHPEPVEGGGKEIVLNLDRFGVSDYIIHIFVLMLAFVWSINLYAQTDTVSGFTKINGKYLLSYWTDTKTIAAAPFHWKGKQWLTFTGVVGATALVYVYDDEIYNFFQDNRTSTKDNISKNFIEPWGSGLYSVPLLAGIYLTGSKNSRHKNIALTGIKAYVLSGGATFILKHAFHRHRPSDNEPPNPNLWDGPYPFTSDYTSFPSGHTATAFAIASVLAHGYKDKLWIVLSSYSVATLVGFSRIYQGEHWASDVLVGAALGTFIGTTLSRVNFKKRVDIYPTSHFGGYGLGAVLHF
jgi:membrane-associated phospholipid phosphatase